jgi:hypothetical protein
MTLSRERFGRRRRLMTAPASTYAGFSLPYSSFLLCLSVSVVQLDGFSNAFNLRNLWNLWNLWMTRRAGCGLSIAFLKFAFVFGPLTCPSADGHPLPQGERRNL